MTVYARPGAEGSVMNFESRYENYIGGEWVAPTAGRYFENVTPVTGKTFCEVARSDESDIEKALDAAHAAAPGWGKMSPADRAVILNKIADRIEENLEAIAVAESWDNGKPVRETLNADIPLAVDHFRYFAGALRAQEGSLSQIDEDTVAYHFHEPLGVVGQIIPWNFPSGSWPPRWRRATPSCLSPPSRRRRRSCT
jgi:aldehyde dehydrogenase